MEYLIDSGNSWTLIFVFGFFLWLGTKLLLIAIDKRCSPYEEKLEDQRWKDKRERILTRDGHKCKWCGRTTNLQVHHKYYNKYPNGKMVDPWDYPDDALMTLCDDCHKKCHQKYQIKIYYRKKGLHYN